MDKQYMQRCFQLALQGIGHVAPNPLVGSVIVRHGRIIGEGYHRQYGKAHAEVNAVAAVENKAWLKEATLYVNLEPCAHYGKTPPCADMIIAHQIPRVVIGCPDSYKEVAGRGIEKLRNAGCRVQAGVLEEQARNLNRRFFTFHEKKRPYIILKWAQTLDGFIDALRPKTMPREPLWITNALARKLVHRWRAEEQAIMVGTTTVEKDNPKLNVRDWTGTHPLRLVIDRHLELPQQSAIFDQTIETIVFTEKQKESVPKLSYQQIDFSQSNGQVIRQVMDYLHSRSITSVIVEGGAVLLNSCIAAGLWDEARVFVGNKWFFAGTRAPQLLPETSHLQSEEIMGDSKLFVFRKGME